MSLVTCHSSLASMNFITLEQLPSAGMSYEFVGETHGAPISAYIVNARPRQGPPLHTHPYVEVIFILEGCATITVIRLPTVSAESQLWLSPGRTPADQLPPLLSPQRLDATRALPEIPQPRFSMRQVAR